MSERSCATSGGTVRKSPNAVSATATAKTIPMLALRRNLRASSHPTAGFKAPTNIKAATNTSSTTVSFSRIHPEAITSTTAIMVQGAISKRTTSRLSAAVHSREVFGGIDIPFSHQPGVSVQVQRLRKQQGVRSRLRSQDHRLREIFAARA